MNTLNPRVVGVLHNLALEEVCFSPNFPLIAYETGFNTINEFMLARAKDYVPDASFDVSYQQSVEWYNEYILGPEDGLKRLREKGYLSAAQYQIINAAVRLVSDALDSKPNPASIALVQTDLSDLQSYVENASFSEEEKGVLIGAISTLQHSALYWSSARENERSKWHEMALRNPLSTSQLASRDMLGLIIGLYVGGGFTPLGFFLGAAFAGFLTMYAMYQAQTQRA